MSHQQTSRKIYIFKYFIYFKMILKKKGVLPKKIKYKKIYFFNFIIFPLYYPIFKPCKWKLCSTNYWLAYYLIFALLLQANTSWARTNCEYIHIIIHAYVYMCFFYDSWRYYVMQLHSLAMFIYLASQEQSSLHYPKNKYYFQWLKIIKHGNFTICKLLISQTDPYPPPNKKHFHRF